MISAPIDDTEPLHVGVGAEQRVVGRRGEVRAGAEHGGEVPRHRRDPLERRPAGDLGRVLEQHLAVEQLGEQVVLGAEVGVRRGRRDPRATRDRADRQPRPARPWPAPAPPAVEQPLDGLRLTRVEPAPRQGGHLTGHLSNLERVLVPGQGSDREREDDRAGGEHQRRQQPLAGRCLVQHEDADEDAQPDAELAERRDRRELAAGLREQDQYRRPRARRLPRPARTAPDAGETVSRARPRLATA